MSATPYDDIIHLPHHVSRTRPHMALSARAVQFAPFAALVGYDAVLQETGRHTETKRELSAAEETDLNQKLAILLMRGVAQPEIIITYFVPDTRKSGGAYQTETGRVKSISAVTRQIVLQNGIIVPFDDIVSLVFSQSELDTLDVIES